MQVILIRASLVSLTFCYYFVGAEYQLGHRPVFCPVAEAYDIFITVDTLLFNFSFVRVCNEFNKVKVKI